MGSAWCFCLSVVNFTQTCGASGTLIKRSDLPSCNLHLERADGTLLPHLSPSVFALIHVRSLVRTLDHFESEIMFLWRGKKEIFYLSPLSLNVQAVCLHESVFRWSMLAICGRGKIWVTAYAARLFFEMFSLLTLLQFSCISSWITYLNQMSSTELYFF